LVLALEHTTTTVNFYTMVLYY